MYFLIVCMVSLIMLTFESTPRNTETSHIDCHGVRPSNNIPTSLEMLSCMLLKPVDCEEIQKLGYNKSGVYNIWPKNKLLDGRVLQVFCDMETDKGGWTVIQRRGNYLRPNDYFFRDWDSYKFGFGDIKEDFWLGNDNIFALTNQRLYSVRFDFKDFDGNHRYALYDTFFIDDEENKYNLTIRDYRGTAGDPMTATHDGMIFSTKDQDNDNRENGSCANSFKGGWWYNACFQANLNGLYNSQQVSNETTSIIWSWNTNRESLAETEIKIRPQCFRKSFF